MPINKSHDENIPTRTEAYYKELASQEETYLDETEVELRAILTFDDLSPSRSGSYVWIDTRIVQTSDGPENAMFCASSTNRSSAHKALTQC
jgi:hypothetical protein